MVQSKQLKLMLKNMIGRLDEMAGYVQGETGYYSILGGGVSRPSGHLLKKAKVGHHGLAGWPFWLKYRENQGHRKKIAKKSQKFSKKILLSKLVQKWSKHITEVV